MDMGTVPTSGLAPLSSLFITLLVLGVFGAGFIEEIWRIAVVNCV